MIAPQSQVDPASAATRTSVSVWAIALIVICQSTQGFSLGGIALFLPLIRDDVGLTFGQAGTLGAVSLLVFAAMQVPAGYLADRFGPKRLFVLGLVGLNLCSLTFALVDSFTLLLVNQALSGLARAFVFAPGLLLITHEFPAHRRATALGLYVAGGFSSNILLSLAGPALVGHVGWRWIFVGFSLLGLGVTALYWRAGSPGPTRQRDSYVRLRELPGLLAHPVMWVAGGVQFVRYSVVNGLSFWLPTYLIAEKGFSLHTAGLLVAAAAVVTAPSNFLGGHVSDRLRRPALVIGFSLAVLTATIVALVSARSLPVVVVVVLVQAIFLQFYFGPLFEIPIRVLGVRTAGLTSGWSNLCANIGGLSFAFGLGQVKDVTGSFAIGMYAMVGLCLLGLVGAYGLSVLLARAAPAAREPALPATDPKRTW
ncbi:MFS transporter [Micromonospora sp. LOL_021]|uniref:MFS transporter n=1 Tax=Micromonospora sp. LOL_021 TaxID=3345417 RepID=UPI003A8513F2